MDRDALAVVPEAAPGAGTPEPPASRNAFRALHSRPFRLYFLGQVASASGTFLQQTAIGWLVLQLTGSAVSLGLVLAAGGLPSLILCPWGGSIADGGVSSAAGPRAALLAGAAACLLAAALAAFVRTPPNPDDALTDLS
jgi:Transmembrane secretion effector